MRSHLRVVVLMSAALFVPLLLPLLTGRVPTLNDLAGYHLPVRHLYSQALERGDVLLWTPSLYGGYYLFGEGQVGMAHPWHLLLYRFLPFYVAFNLEIISSYVVLFIGMGLLFRRFRLAPEAAWFGAMVFTFSGYSLFHLMHVNVIAVTAHLPWLLLASQRLMTSDGWRPRVRAGAAIALLVGSQLLLGHAQSAWLTLIPVGVLVGALVWQGVPVVGLGWLAAAGVVGVLIAGVQLLPTLDLVRETARTEWTRDTSLTFSLSPWNLVQLWSPLAFLGRAATVSAEANVPHEFIVYNGVFCTLACSWLALRWRSLRDRRLTGALLVFTAAALVLAFGRYGVYRWLVGLPGLHWFRAPARHLVLFHLGLSGLAAIAFEDLARTARESGRIAADRLRPLAWPIVLSVATTGIAAILSRSSRIAAWGFHLSPWPDAAIYPLLFVLVAGLMVLASRGARWALPVLILVVAAAQGWWGYRYVYGDPLRQPQTVEALAERARIPDGARPGDAFQPKRDEGLENLPVLRGFRVFTGYVGLVPALTLPIGRPSLLTHRLAGLKWRLSGAFEYEPVQATAGRARLVSVARMSTDVAADVKAIDILSEAIVSEPIEPLTGPPGQVRIAADRPGRMVLDVATPGRQLLVITERYHSGWHVSDNRAEGRVVRVYGDFLGCVVDEGTHRLIFTFEPASLREGLWVSAAGLGLVVVALLALWR